MIAERSMSNESVGVSLTCAVRRYAERLEVRYRVSNRRDQAVAVLNQIPSVGIDEAPEYDPNDVYVDLNDGVLQFTKGALPIPPGLFPNFPLKPDAVMLAPGASLEETFVVPIPVKVRNPYVRAMTRAPGGARGLGVPGETIAVRKTSARALVVAVGVVPSGSACTFASNHPAYPNILTPMDLKGLVDPVPPDQTMLSVRLELEEDLPVLGYQCFPWPSLLP